MLELFTILLLAHIFGDFVFQTSKSVEHKEAKKHKSIHLYLHVGIHAFCLCIIILLTEATNTWVIIPISIAHYTIDVAKLYLQNERNTKVLFFINQGMHIAVLFAFATYCTEGYPLPTSVVNTNSISFITLLLLATLVPSILVRILRQNWDKDIDKQNKKESLKSAGKYIGLLEPLLVFKFVKLNQWSAIGFLIAAKPAFRFGDLSEAKNRKLTEYALIGTLLSFGLAMFLGIVYLKLKTIE